MAGVNKVILIGNLGNDPETRYLPSGSAVTNISIATSETWLDKQTSQKVEKTEWHRVVFFNKLAEIAAQYLKKGSKVYVEGSLETKKYQAQDGTDRYATQIKANNMQMLDSRDNAESLQPRQPQPTQPTQRPAPPTPPLATQDFDDDIPF